MGIEGKIKFENGRSQFYGGEKVMGSVEIIVPANCAELKEVEVQIKGRAKWAIKRGNRTTYLNHTFWKESTRVFGNGEQTIPLERGTISYPFATVLPQNVPSSYKSDEGEIYYQVKVIIPRDLLWNKKIKARFEVQGVLDIRKLDLNPAVPIEITGEKSIWFCASGNIQFVLRMPRDKVFTNEILPFTLVVENHSSKRIKATRVQLFQVIKFTYNNGGLHARDLSPVLPETNWGAVEPGCTETYSGGNLRIPNDLPPTNDTSLIIRTEYILRVKLKIQRLINLCKEVPIVIGHLPPSPERPEEFNFMNPVNMNNYLHY